jgi:hypothetical protein
VPTGSVTITGAATQGQTLTANNTLADADGLGILNYQWKASGTAITGATESSYVLTQAEVGKSITVTASYTDGRSTEESISSNASQLIEGIIVGATTAGPDTIIGTERADTLMGDSGNDTLIGGGGNDAIDGGTGIDISAYGNDREDYTIAKTSGGFTVSAKTGLDGIDTLSGIERLMFADGNVALDIDGNAGTIAKLFGVVFGKDNWYNKELIGQGLKIIDDNVISFDALMGLAFGAILGPAPSNKAVVNLIYNSLIGQTPSEGQLNILTADLLDSGAFTQGGLGVLAAENELNAANIGLVGLADTGLQYSYIS